MKTIILFAVLSMSVAHAQENGYEITNAEKREACKEMIDTLDYEGSTVSQCMEGKWIVSDVEKNGSNKQVSFSWTGRLSSEQKRETKCYGYVVTSKPADRAKLIRVIDLDCN